MPERTFGLEHEFFQFERETKKNVAFEKNLWLRGTGNAFIRGARVPIFLPPFFQLRFRPSGYPGGESFEVLDAFFSRR